MLPSFDVFFAVIPVSLMQLTVTAKQIGRKHSLIDKTIIKIGDIGLHPTVRDLLNAVVTQQVAAYNVKSGSKSLLPILDTAAINDQSVTGKISFGVVYNDNKADLDQAKATALQAFEDGMFAIFADDIQLNKLEETFPLSTNTLITFIRLTFLAGTYW